MKLLTLRHMSVAAVVAGAIGIFAPATSTQTSGRPERFTAFAVSTGGPRTRPVAETVQINVTRWSTEAERQQLVDALAKGPQKLLDALQDLRDVGTIRTPDSLGYPLRYAHQRPLEDGGRRVVIMTDRPIRFWEAVNRPRSIDYPFTLVELKLDSEGTGEGKLSFATKITSREGVIELENYDVGPIMLNRVKAESTH